MCKNIIITGSGGILGTALIQKLTATSELTVYAMTSQVDRLVEEYNGKENVHVYATVEELPDELDYIVIHCAFPRMNKGKELAAALEYTEELITQLATKNIQYFVNISSQSVYAQSGDEIQTEESSLAPNNLYGMVKYAVEQIVRLVCVSYKINYTNIRLGSLASPSFDQRMINRFYKMIKKKETIQIDQGTPKVSYLYLEDAADALVQLCKAIASGQKIDSVYNLANNDWLSIPELVEKCNTVGIKIGIGQTEVIQTDNQSEYNNVVNSQRIYNHLNWKPQYSMEKMIVDIFTKKSITN